MGFLDFLRGALESPTQRVQKLLSEGKAAAAWAESARLREARDGLDSEALATIGVAAAATGRHEAAVEEFRLALQQATSSSDGTLEGLRVLLANAETLLEQSHGRGELLTGPLWLAVPPPEPPVPPAWKSWVATMPKVAEYVGPVEVRWAPHPITGEPRGRGLFATRDVKAGEVLLSSWPIARAEKAEGLIAACHQARAESGRARRRLAYLADGTPDQQMPPIETTDKALSALPDEVPQVGEFEEVPNITGAINSNCFSMAGWAGLYGLPSMLNHNCDGHDANALKLVLVFLDGAIIFRAARDVKAGEELCHRYFDCEAPLHVRRESSASWHFKCDCRRCLWEDTCFQCTPACTAATSAMTAWKSRLKATMHGLAKPPGGDGKPPPDTGPFLSELMELQQALVSAVEAEQDWGEAQLGWCFAILQPLSNAALWCTLRDKEPEALRQRCKLLRWIVLSWEHTERYGFDHLRTLHLYWSALEEVLCLELGPAAAEEGLPPERVVELRDCPAGRAAEEAKHLCEKAFFCRFGITPEDLALGAPQSRATGLLKRLRG